MPATADTPDRFLHERSLATQGRQRIAGVDEVGRGPLAGPVVAAAVVLPPAMLRDGLPASLAGLNDSKQLTPARRERLFAALHDQGEIRFGLGQIEPDEIDRLNILRATHRAMSLALEALPETPDHLLIDGLPVPGLAGRQTALVKGDSLSFSIAAASVLAKVTRDRLMDRYDEVHPGYGFRQHKGYPTRAHLEAIRRLGPCAIHRRSFAPFRQTQLELLQAGTALCAAVAEP